MQKIVSLMFLLVFLTACNGTSTGTETGTDCLNDDGSPCVTDTTTPPVDGDDGIGDEDPVPSLAETFDVNITFVNFTPEQEDKMLKAIEIIKKVVATDEFKSKVLSHTYNGSKTYVDNGGYSNAQIYQKILDGAERLNNPKNNTMDVEVELYYEASSTVGYTYASSKRIWVNTKFFNTYTPASVAANLFHEWLHKVGFTHAVSYSTSRDYSVPYAIGRIIGSLGKQYL